ncbi:sensor histidine kinase [Anaerosporobacter sp.]|uniref:sensor histidine kinase n=1 Tax=Anaerosporobacter sp. TaxID=1872529 RepID=UPI00286F843D|nr:HAMP domain-containing sensor histidine kinase [Anaerosporobacter sp.]
MILSISHDIKTPLSAIKLYSKALSKKLYKTEEKQHEIAESINAKADEIENFISQIIKASSEDFLDLQVENTEFYLTDLITKIKNYYSEKLLLLHINFAVGDFSNCLLCGDLNRSIEVLQNIIENAIKYGDGHKISIEFSREEECQLVTVTNSGCTLSENEIPHMFDSFWRGSNVSTSNGSGLGLYICRQLMNKMNGDIYAHMKGEEIEVACVFEKM